MGARALVSLLGAVAVVSCGGASESNDGGSGKGGTATAGSGAGGSPLTGGASGRAGWGGGGQSANGGKGGSSTAGSGVGGGAGGSAATGGTIGLAGSGLSSGGRAPAGGSGGTGVTGGTSGSGPVAGAGGAENEACSLPLEIGPCDAAIPRYGFNPKTQRCEPFSYGGCQGNANNFETFEACASACGLADESNCPAAMPDAGTACAGPEHPCDYSGVTRCLCQPDAQFSCPELPSAAGCNDLARILPPSGEGGASGACTEPGCTQAIVVISYFECSCDSSWTCLVGGQSGGPR